MKVRIWHLGNGGIQLEGSRLASWRRCRTSNNAHNGFKKSKTGDQKGQVKDCHSIPRKESYEPGSSL